jgi:P27 family predicted phage terminase small subunit
MWPVTILEIETISATRRRRMGGRRPLPTQTRIAEGNRGHRPIDGDDVEPTADAPEMPKGLSRSARREFRFMCRTLLDLGVLTVVDGRALAAYCEAFAQKEKASKELNRLGAAIETFAIDKSGERVFLRIEKNPWWSIWVDACKLEKSFLIEFGLTPASRRNLKIPFKPKEDELDRVMARGRTAPMAFSLKEFDQAKRITKDSTDPPESKE